MPSQLHPEPAATARIAQVPPAATAKPIRIVLAGGNGPRVHELSALLAAEQGMEVIALADDLPSVKRQVYGHQPDVLVLELSMAGESCIQAIGQLREQVPCTEIVALSTDEDPVAAQRVLTVGASGYVSAQRIAGELSRAVHAAGRGEQFLSPPVATRLDALHQLQTEHALTPREVEVLRLIALGHTSVEIARKLRLSPRTVETHRAHIHKKLQLTTRAQLVRYALRRGLLGM
jgi:two-component system, NarL family, response regulator NreC